MKTIELTNAEAGYLYTVLGYRFVDLEQNLGAPQWYDNEADLLFDLRRKLWDKATEKEDNHRK